MYDLLALTASKPSFLLWEKVYSKLVTVEEGLWFVRALSCAFLQGQNEVAKNQTLRYAVQIGSFLSLYLQCYDILGSILVSPGSTLLSPIDSPSSAKLPSAP